MRLFKRALRTSTFLAWTLALATIARAGTTTLQCEANPALNAPEMTIVYEGETQGTLTIKAPFGEMSLPATMESRQGTDETGQPLSAHGIRAAGPATVQMPDKAAIEACVRGKLPPDQLADSDIVFVTVMSCAKEVPVGAEPIAINASAEIALAPLVYVGVTRTYAEPTDLAVGTIALEAYPNCSIVETQQ
jgi:hypothetical protein